MTGPALRVQNLCKCYGRIQALTGVSFTISPNTITAFLGENGAGKTTTLKIILGFLRPDRGVVRLTAEPVGYVPEHPVFFPWLRGGDILSSTAQLFKISEPSRRMRIEKISCVVGFDPRLLERKTGTYSLGNQKKFAYLQNLIICPQLLIVDEPFSSLDPLAIKGVRNLLTELRNEGKTVVLSSHLLSELEKTCDEFIMIRKGKVVVHFERDESEPINLESIYLYFHQTGQPFGVKGIRPTE